MTLSTPRSLGCPKPPWDGAALELRLLESGLEYPCTFGKKRVGSGGREGQAGPSCRAGPLCQRCQGPCGALEL